MVTAGVAVGLIAGLVAVLLRVIRAMVMRRCCSTMMVLRAVVHAVTCGGIRAACRRRKCRQTLQRQGQQQQPDGSQSQAFHGYKSRGF